VKVVNDEKAFFAMARLLILIMIMCDGEKEEEEEKNLYSGV
jgi:hypothetical protein